MSLSDSVDSVPTFKKALQDLSGRYNGLSNLSSIVEEVLVFSHALNRRADQKLLRQAASHLESLLETLKALSSEDPSYQTSVFAVENFGDDSLANHFDNLFTKLSSSLPNVFTADDDERAKAVESTIKHLEEIGRFAEIHGNSHVVGLSDAMVSVVKFHKESLVESGSESDNGFLVKPLLRGFALLRTAFDSPDEPNLSPALIDSTANLRDLIGDQANEPSAFDFDYSSNMVDHLCDETVVEASQPQMKPLPRRSSETKKTVAFQSISALTAPPASPATEDSTPEIPVLSRASQLGKKNQNDSLTPSRETKSTPDHSEHTDSRESQKLDTETSVESLSTKPNRIATLVYGFPLNSKKIDRISHAFPLSTKPVLKLDDALNKLKTESFDFIICNGELEDKLLSPIYDLIDALDDNYKLPIALVTSLDDFSFDIVFPRETPEFSKYLLKNIVIEDDDVPDLFE